MIPGLPRLDNSSKVADEEQGHDWTITEQFNAIMPKLNLRTLDTKEEQNLDSQTDLIFGDRKAEDLILDSPLQEALESSLKRKESLDTGLSVHLR